MKKVCFVSSSAYGLIYPGSQVQFGGAAVQLYQLARALAYCGNYDISFIIEDYGQKEERREGIFFYKSFKRHRNRRIKFLYYISSLFQILITLNRANADVYIQRGASIETALIAFYCRIYKKKFVYMIAHERDCNGEFASRGIRGMLYRWGLHQAHSIIVQHTLQASFLLEHEKKQSSILKSGYSIPSKPSQVSDRRYILWVGRLVEWKGPDIFLSIAKYFPDEQFVFIGDGSSEYSQNVQFAISTFPNILYYRFVSFENINRYFQQAKIFVNTSLYEGFPNTFIQAAMNGVPIISLSVNPENILNEYRIGYCANNDFDAMVSQIRCLLSNMNDYKRRSTNAFTYASKMHNIDAISMELRKVIEPLFI